MKKTLQIFLFIILEVSFLQTAFAQAVIDQRLKEALVNAVSPLEVVVTFKGNSAPTAEQISVLKQAGIIQGLTFRSLPIAGVLATAAQVDALSKNSQVRSLYLNSKLEYFNNNSRALTGVDRLRNDQTLTTRNGGLPVSGKGVTVLVNDSGIDATHPDLPFGSHVLQNVLGTANPHAYSDMLPINYIENIPNTDNNSGHGTHVAGIIAGTGAKSKGKYQGVAPGANLVGYGSGAVLLVLDVLGGFDYGITYQKKYGIKIISNSWGTSGRFDPNDPVNVATYLAYKNGITVLFSAGNSGPFESTLSPYAAPWVITVAAGDKYGNLVDFSSRGIKGDNYYFTIDGQSFYYQDQPTITAPGLDVVSTRTIAPVAFLESPSDTSIEPAYLPYYTHLSGTSMACPHAAGITALILQANPDLTPDEVKSVIELTATNMPNHEAWEVGAGYINAYAAVDYVFRHAAYGSSVNMNKKFNSNLTSDVQLQFFTVDFNPVASLSSDNNSWTFQVPQGQNVLYVLAFAAGQTGLEGNPVDVGLYAPDGSEYHSDIYVFFPIFQDRAVTVLNPIPGTWTLKISALFDFGVATVPAFPEKISGIAKFTKFTGYSGLNDISGNPAENAIKLAVSERLIDGYADGTFKPANNLARIELANYMMMGQGIRQYLPTDGSTHFTDVAPDQTLAVESVTARGAALRDRFQVADGVMLPASSGIFNPFGTVNRVDVAYSMVQSMGIQDKAKALAGTEVKAHYRDQSIPIDDASGIPDDMKGYVQLAIDMNLINVYFSLQQGPYDLSPVLHASFKPANIVTRGDFAVIVIRTFDKWKTPDPSLGKGKITSELSVTQPLKYDLYQNYPNPFNPSTVIKYSIPSSGLVNLEVYNMLGQRVATLVNEVKPAGEYSINFDAGKLSSGVYVYRISSDNYVKTMKMTLMK